MRRGKYEGLDAMRGWPSTSNRPARNLCVTTGAKSGVLRQIFSDKELKIYIVGYDENEDKIFESWWVQAASGKSQSMREWVIQLEHVFVGL